MTDNLQTVLRALIACDSRALLTLGGSEDQANDDAAVFGDLSDAQIDAALEEAKHQGLIEGERQETAGTAVFWSGIRLNVRGLREIGEWPPHGKESMPGPWESGVWGHVDMLVLNDVDQNLDDHRFVFMPFGREDHERLDELPAWEYWTSVRRLIEAGLLDGDEQGDGIANVRVTQAGRRVLQPTTLCGIDLAEADLRVGSRLQAAMHAGVALEEHLKALAAAHDVPAHRDDGRERTSAQINDGLKAARVYNEVDRAYVQAWLAVRNEVAHSGADEVTDMQVSLMIEGVRDFFARRSVA